LPYVLPPFEFPIAEIPLYKLAVYIADNRRHENSHIFPKDFFPRIAEESLGFIIRMDYLALLA
jgi:hypothetical protein